VKGGIYWRTGCLLESLEGIDCSEDVDIDGGIILKWIFWIYG
jgi:hypothetical protein